MADQNGRGTMEDRAERLTQVLHTAAETHHIVFGIVDGVDADWASWYSDWLINLSEMPEILGGRPVRSELTFALVGMDREYTQQQTDEPWESFYARDLIRRFGSG